MLLVGYNLRAIGCDTPLEGYGFQPVSPALLPDGPIDPALIAETARQDVLIALCEHGPIVLESLLHDGQSLRSTFAEYRPC